MRVLDRDENAPRLIRVGRTERILHVVRMYDAHARRQTAQLDLRVQRARAGFVMDEVAVLLADDFPAGSRQDPDGDLVRHGTRRHEERRVAAEDLAREVLQPIDRRVFAVAVVAEFGVRHGAPHLVRRQCDGVGPEVDVSVVSHRGV